MIAPKSLVDYCHLVAVKASERLCDKDYSGYRIGLNSVYFRIWLVFSQLLIRGRHVFMGYLDQPEKTNEVFDSEGWHITGDLAKKDDDGFLYVTGKVSGMLISFSIRSNLMMLVPLLSSWYDIHSGYRCQTSSHVSQFVTSKLITPI